MKQMRVTLITAILTVLVAVPMLASHAWAIPMLRLTQGATQVTITDDGAGDLLGTTPGAVVYAGSVGTFNFNLVSGLAKPLLGSAVRPMMDLSFQNMSTSMGTLIMEFSEDGLVGVAPGVMGFSGFIDGNSFSSATTVRYELVVSMANAHFSGTVIGDTGFLSANEGASGLGFSGAFQTIPVNSAPYALTTRVTLTHQRAGVTSGDAGVAPVPEPSSLILLTTGLAGMAFWRYKKRHSTIPD